MRSISILSAAIAFILIFVFIITIVYSPQYIALDSTFMLNDGKHFSLTPERVSVGFGFVGVHIKEYIPVLCRGVLDYYTASVAQSSSKIYLGDDHLYMALMVISSFNVSQVSPSFSLASAHHRIETLHQDSFHRTAQGISQGLFMLQILSRQAQSTPSDFVDSLTPDGLHAHYSPILKDLWVSCSGWRRYSGGPVSITASNDVLRSLSTLKESPSYLFSLSTMSDGRPIVASRASCLFRFIISMFDVDSGGFRDSNDDLPSLSATYHAILLLKELGDTSLPPSGTSDMEEQHDPSRTAHKFMESRSHRIAQFILSCQRHDGSFSSSSQKTNHDKIVMDTTLAIISIGQLSRVKFVSSLNFTLIAAFEDATSYLGASVDAKGVRNRVIEVSERVPFPISLIPSSLLASIEIPSTNSTPSVVAAFSFSLLTNSELYIPSIVSREIIWSFGIVILILILVVALGFFLHVISLSLVKRIRRVVVITVLGLTLISVLLPSLLHQVSIVNVSVVGALALYLTMECWYLLKGRGELLFATLHCVCRFIIFIFLTSICDIRFESVSFFIVSSVWGALAHLAATFLCGVLFACRDYNIHVSASIIAWTVINIWHVTSLLMTDGVVANLVHNSTVFGLYVSIIVTIPIASLMSAVVFSALGCAAFDTVTQGTSRTKAASAHKARPKQKIT